MHASNRRSTKPYTEHHRSDLGRHTPMPNIIINYNLSLLALSGNYTLLLHRFISKHNVAIMTIIVQS